MTRLGIIGGNGRMGQALVDAANEAGLAVAGAIDVGGDPVALAKASDILIDFSSRDALEASLGSATSARIPLVIGTTGLSEEHHVLIDRTATHIPILQTGNFSLGITLLAKLVEQAATTLGGDWDIEILEMHHHHKIDAPSGTALLLGEAAAAGRGTPLAGIKDIDRNHKRNRGDIGFASLRGGSVFGDHQVIMAGNGERIELGHRAESREVFARGALTAAQWLIGKPAKRYTMRDVLGL